MRFKMISCEVFSRPAYHAAAKSKHIVDMEFTKLRSHLYPGWLKDEIQGMIDRTPEQYDAILLGFGICGNSTSGLTARSIPIVIPRAHDCCTIFLGSRQNFMEHFGTTPSAQWNTACYYERSDGWYSDNVVSLLSSEKGNEYSELVEKYGEENAQYIWETMNTGTGINFLTYIDLPGFGDESIREDFIKYAAESEKDTRFLQGSTRLIDQLLSGDWPEDDFLHVPPGASIKPVYDQIKVMEI